MKQRRLIFVHSILALMLVSSCAHTQPEAGNLHESIHDQWKVASAGNKFSTASDWIEEFAAGTNEPTLTASKERTIKVVDCIDSIVSLSDQGPNFGKSETRTK